MSGGAVHDRIFRDHHEGAAAYSWAAGPTTSEPSRLVILMRPAIRSRRCPAPQQHEGQHHLPRLVAILSKAFRRAQPRRWLVRVQSSGRGERGDCGHEHDHHRRRGIDAQPTAKGSDRQDQTQEHERVRIARRLVSPPWPARCIRRSCGISLKRRLIVFFRPKATCSGPLLPELYPGPGDARVGRTPPPVCPWLRLVGKLNQSQGFAPGSVDFGDQEELA
jgi:hypothetical protein